MARARIVDPVPRRIIFRCHCEYGRQQVRLLLCPLAYSALFKNCTVGDGEEWVKLLVVSIQTAESEMFLRQTGDKVNYTV